MEHYHFVNVPYGFAVVHPHQMAPFNNLLYGNVIETPIPNVARRFILKRSVFDLVKLYHALELTDPKLLGWYLSLPPGDRKIIQDDGGFHQFLQRHPALELGKQHVYVKYDTGCFTQLAMSSNLYRPTFNEVISCVTCGTSSQLGATECRHCKVPFQRQNVFSERGTHSNLLTSCGYQDKSQGANTQLRFAQCHLNELLNQFHHSSKEMELKQSGQRQTDSADLAKDQNSPPMCHNLDGTQMVPARCDDNAITFLAAESNRMTSKHGSNQLVSVEAGSGPLGGTTGRSSLPVDDQVCDSASAPGAEPFPPGKQASASFASIMQEDESILLYKAIDAHGPPTAEKSSSTLPPVDTCEKSVGTELSLTPCQPAATQTDAQPTAAKGVNTVLRITDLDFVVEEFGKLKLAQKELQELKAKMTSGGYDQRAQKSELRLLALQLGICQQHCWRHYYTSPDGDRFTRMQGDMPMEPPESLVSVLETLQCDYEEMRAKILAGVPLDQLKPLSVDSHKLSTGGHFIPAQFCLTNTFDGRSKEWKSRDSGGHRCLSSKGSQETHNLAPMEDWDSGKSGEGVAILSRPTGSRCGWRSAEAAAGQDVNVTEDWYDAKEDLEPAEPACPAEMAQTPLGSSGSVRDLMEPRNTLCVSGLPRNATEGDVELWFEKYGVSDVKITQLKDGLRVALVELCEPQLADMAVREMSGFSAQGSVLRVERVSKQQASCSIPSSPPDVATVSLGSETTSPQVVSVQVDWLSEKRKITSDRPTAKGTCVPQYYASLAGFDALMAQLAERHPQVERQKFVDALEEVVAKHKHTLIRLPLTTIADMISDVLKSS